MSRNTPERDRAAVAAGRDKNSNRQGALTRRDFLQTAAAASLGVMLGAGRSQGEAAVPAAGGKGKPNFVFILVDDLRHDALGCLGRGLVESPNLDTLAARGVTFTNAFVTCSICSPSRAACLTGRYGSANGVMKLDASLKPGEKTFAHYLKDELGYRTGMIGKWHIGNTPASCGFERVMQFHSNGPYRNRRILNQGNPERIPGYIDEFSAGQALEFIDDPQASGRPFALFFCTQAPHMPWTPKPATLARYRKKDIPLPETWNDDLAGKPPYLQTARFRTRAQQDYGYSDKAAVLRHHRQYYATITELDEALGGLIRRLERPDLRENTYIILMGDNGWSLGEHGLTSKVLPYEESIRVPMIIAGPGLRPAKEDRMALNVDLAPTMLALAGARVPQTMHGRSLAPLLHGPGGGGWRESILYEALEPELESWPLAAVRTGRHKYVQTFDVKAPEKLAFEELYDLEHDPREMHNLAGDAGQKARLEELKAELARLRKRIGTGP